MGLDLYAGTITRYYAHDWETKAQQIAKERGFGYKRFDSQDGTEQNIEVAKSEADAALQEEASSKNQTTFSVEQINLGANNWMSALCEGLKSGFKAEISPWVENNVIPYYTDKLTTEAYGALLLVIAGTTYYEEYDAKIKNGWRFYENPLVDRMMRDKVNINSISKGTSCWVPVSHPCYFEYVMPSNQKALIGTLALLSSELEAVNKLIWQADEQTILSWTETEGFPKIENLCLDERFTGNMSANSEYDTMSLAKFAYSLFYRAVQFAKENQVPIILDY